MRGHYIFFGIIVVVILGMIGFRGYMITTMTKDGKPLLKLVLPFKKEY
jgi:hypothetical protein